MTSLVVALVALLITGFSETGLLVEALDAEALVGWSGFAPDVWSGSFGLATLLIATAVGLLLAPVGAGTAPSARTPWTAAVRRTFSHVSLALGPRAERGPPAISLF